MVGSVVPRWALFVVRHFLRSSHNIAVDVDVNVNVVDVEKRRETRV